MDQSKIALLLGDRPTLSKDVWLDSYADKDTADRMRVAYANLLSGNGLADRYGVFVRKIKDTRLGNWWFGIFVGPQEDTEKAKV